MRPPLAGRRDEARRLVERARRLLGHAAVAATPPPRAGVADPAPVDAADPATAPADAVASAPAEVEAVVPPDAEIVAARLDAARERLRATIAAPADDASTPAREEGAPKAPSPPYP